MPQIEIPSELSGADQGPMRDAFVEVQKKVLGDPKRYSADIHVVVRARDGGAVIAKQEFTGVVQYGIWAFSADDEAVEGGKSSFSYDFLSSRENAFQAQKVIEDRWLYGGAKEILSSMMMRDQMRGAIADGGRKVFPASVLDLPKN